jgi:hypothetical protein
MHSQYQLRAASVTSRRLELSPLKASDADEMYGVLNHEELYRYTGGEPPTLDQLKARYERLATQLSPGGREAWLNWILRLRDTGTAIGTMQASASGDNAALAGSWACLGSGRDLRRKQR